MKNISGSEAFGIQKKKSRRGLAQISVLHHKSLVAEQYRTIRTNIEFSSVQTHLRSILVTSSVPGEGKSFSAANLAAVFAQQEKRCCSSMRIYENRRYTRPISLKMYKALRMC